MNFDTMQIEDFLREYEEAQKLAQENQELDERQQAILEEGDKLLENTGRSVEFLAATTAPQPGEAPGTVKVDSMLDSVEEFARLDGIYKSEKLMEEIYQSMDDETKADDVSRRLADIEALPQVQQALEATALEGELTVGDIKAGNAETHKLMEEFGINPDGKESFLETVSVYAMHERAGLSVREIVEETEVELSERQLREKAEKLYEGNWRSEDEEDIMRIYNLTPEQTSFVCAVLAQKEREVVVEATVDDYGNVSKEKFDEKTGIADKSSFTSSEVQRAGKAAGKDLKNEGAEVQDNDEETKRKRRSVGLDER